MNVKRIVANIQAADPAQAAAFYRDVLGLDLRMDHSWIQVYGADTTMTVQVGFAAHGGSGTPVPPLSIEVDDLDATLQRLRAAGVALEYGPVSEPWGVRRVFVRDPFGTLVNILQHE